MKKFPPSDIPPQNHQGDPVRFRQHFGPWTGALTVLAVVIGAGIFSVPQRVAAFSDGPIMMLSLWLIVGLVCLAASLVWAELGSRLPFAGSDFLAIREGFGRHVAFLYGWKSLTIGAPTSRAALALVGAEYGAVLFPVLGGHEIAVGAVLIVVLCLANMQSLSSVIFINVTSAAFKVAVLVVFLIMVFLSSGQQPATEVIATAAPEGSLLKRMALASLLVFFSYNGWSRIAVVAEEFRDPGKELVKSMVISMVGAIVLYMLMNLAYLHALGINGMRTNPAVGSATMDMVFGKAGAIIFALVVVVSVIGSMSASIMAVARVYYAMAKSGTFFRFFHHLGRRSAVPERAIWIHLIGAIIMLLLKQNFVDLVTSAIFMNLIFFSVRVASLFVLRKQRIGEEHGGYRVPLYPILPIIVLLFMLALLVIRVIYDWDRAWFDLALLGVGIPASIWWFRWQDSKATPVDA
ncbi:MAG: amino acid permease [Saprospiraceae bacterium]|nr:amino acid permease [Saprospiraceae bacterium]